MRHPRTISVLFTTLLAAFVCLTWVSPSAAGGLINVNTATVEELQQLPGIGPSRAIAIVEHRERHGHFRSVDSLTDVSGIGPAILSRIRDRVTVEPAGAPAAPRPAPESERPPPPDRRTDREGFDLDLTREDQGSTFADRKARLAAQEGRTQDRVTPRPSAPETPDEPPAPARQPTSGPAGLINLNTAGEEALTTLPGIGPARAAAIISHRSAHGPFRSVDQVTDVSGIGPATLRNIRDKVTVLLDLNTAGLEELAAIGLDIDAAERLIEWRRQHGPFRSVDQMTEVPGFGRGALETLRPYLWVGNQ